MGADGRNSGETAAAVSGYGGGKIDVANVVSNGDENDQRGSRRFPAAPFCRRSAMVRRWSQYDLLTSSG